MSVKARKQLASRGKASAAGWIKNPEVRRAAEQFNEKVAGQVEHLRKSLPDRSEDIGTFVFTMTMTVLRAPLLGADWLEPRRVKPLGLNSTQMAIANNIVEVARGVLFQLQRNSVPVAPEHDPNIATFVQLALCATSSDWQLEADELVQRLPTAANVLFATNGRGTKSNDHARRQDAIDAYAVRQGLRNTIIQNPYARGGKSQSMKDKQIRLGALREVLQQHPDAKVNDIRRSYQSTNPNTPGCLYRGKLGQPVEALRPSYSTLSRDLKEVRSDS